MDAEDEEVQEVPQEAEQQQQLQHPGWQQLTPYRHREHEEQEVGAKYPITLRFINGEEVQTVIGRDAVAEDLMRLAREHRGLEHMHILHFMIMRNNQHLNWSTNISGIGVTAGAVLDVVITEVMWV